MKTSLALFSALCLLALAAPSTVMAHHQIAGADRGYLVFWKGIPPKHGQLAMGSTDLWRVGFVSKFRIVGAPACP